jgi:hypothetical protein
MKIEIVKFGDFLMSRPAGREAWLAMKAYTLPGIKNGDTVEVDFSGVKVLTPSWADEVISKLKGKFDKVVLLNTENSSVKASLRTLEEMPTK